MKRGINIENSVLSLKIPIKLVINKAGELNAFIDSGERERDRKSERELRICIFHGERQSVCT